MTKGCGNSKFLPRRKKSIGILLTHLFTNNSEEENKGEFTTHYFPPQESLQKYLQETGGTREGFEKAFLPSSLRLSKVKSKSTQKLPPIKGFASIQQVIAPPPPTTIVSPSTIRHNCW